MNARLRLAKILLLGTGCVVATHAVSAEDPLAPSEPHWRLVLQQQLKAEQACSLNEILTFAEVPLGDDVGQDGRVSCFDGREFIFSRKGRNKPFRIEVCAPSVC